MDYFKVSNKNSGSYIHFTNRKWSIYWSESNPNLLKELGITPNKFVKKANALFSKYNIKIPKAYPKYRNLDRDDKVDNTPINDFLICIYCCIHLEEDYGIDSSKILRYELIKPNSNSGIHHACSVAVIALNYLKKNRVLTIPLEKEDELNPDLIIDNLKCEVKTIQELDWTKEVDPETGFGKVRTRGVDLCYDIGNFIAKEKSGYKGILQGEVLFADLTLKFFGDITKDIRGLGYGDNLQYDLPELKKCRLVFFSKILLDCVAYYIDFEPRLWNLIQIADGIEYRRVIHSFKIPADGKSHKITLATPPEEKN